MIVETLAWVVYLLGRQELAFYGHCETINKESKMNPGYFPVTLQEVAHYQVMLPPKWTYVKFFLDLLALNIYIYIYIYTYIYIFMMRVYKVSYI